MSEDRICDRCGFNPDVPEPIMFSPEDIGLCGADNSDDLGMIAGTVATCLRCEQDNCPVYQALEAFRKPREKVR